MRLVSWCLALLCALPVSFHAAPAHAGTDAGLRLNEFVAGPARDWDKSGSFSTRDDEWVEIVNAGVTTVALDGFFLTDGDSLPRYAFSGVLDAGGHLLVTGRQSYDWERATGHPAFGLSLANTGDTVMLWKVAGAETLLVDAYTYRSHEAAADRAVGRSPGMTGDWVIFDALNPYAGTTPPKGNGCEPTPAAPNTCGTTPVRPESWGRVKVLYR
jgi:hypothetical protein